MVSSQTENECGEVVEEEDKKEFRTKAGTGGDLGLLLFLLEDEAFFLSLLLLLLGSFKTFKLVVLTRGWEGIQA